VTRYRTMESPAIATAAATTTAQICCVDVNTCDDDGDDDYDDDDDDKIASRSMHLDMCFWRRIGPHRHIKARRKLQYSTSMLWRAARFQAIPCPADPLKNSLYLLYLDTHWQAEEGDMRAISRDTALADPRRYVD
jgi:hypothetical protein